MKVASDGVRTWWWAGDGFCWENCDYDARDVLAQVKDRERRRQRELERAHMLLNVAQLPQQQRGAVTREMRKAVYERDGSTCTECGSAFDLQYDHILPVALGGATTVDNLQLLCSSCNLAKGAAI